MTFLVWVYTSQDFAQTQQNFARSHDRVTVTFRNSAVERFGVSRMRDFFNAVGSYGWSYGACSKIAETINLPKTCKIISSA